MNDLTAMQSLADRLWDFFRPKVIDILTDSVDYYKATVTSAYNPSTGLITVQKPFDIANEIPCSPRIRNAPVGSQVIVLVFGKGANNINSKVFAYYDLSDDDVIKAGDTLELSNAEILAGLVTSDSKSIYFSIPTAKKILAQNVAISGEIIVRTVNGYVSYNGSTTIDTDDFPSSCLLDIDSGTVRVRLVNSGAWEDSGGTAIQNNTPASVFISSATLTFT